MIMEKIKIEVERLVEEELKKRSKEESISKKLFQTDDEGDHEADKLFRKRIEMTYEEDEKRLKIRQSCEPNPTRAQKEPQEIPKVLQDLQAERQQRRAKKEWFDEQQKIK